MAFALSGFMAGYAGVCLAFATERFSTDTFDPTISILVVSMVVIGGLDAIPGALLGALYLVGLPAIFGSSTTVAVPHQRRRAHGLHPLSARRHGPGHAPLGDLVTAGVENLQARRRGGAPPDRARHPRPRSPRLRELTATGAVAEVIA